MASADSRTEYELRMHRVVEHIDRHLDEPSTCARCAFDPQTSVFQCRLCIPVGPL